MDSMKFHGKSTKNLDFFSAFFSCSSAFLGFLGRDPALFRRSMRCILIPKILGIRGSSRNFSVYCHSNSNPKLFISQLLITDCRFRILPLVRIIKLWDLFQNILSHNKSKERKSHPVLPPSQRKGKNEPNLDFFPKIS